jgi:hypothetical protein
MNVLAEVHAMKTITKQLSMLERGARRRVLKYVLTWAEEDTPQTPQAVSREDQFRLAIEDISHKE